MKIDPAARLTRDSITLGANEIEAVLQGPPLDVKPFAPRSVALENRSGEAMTMLIRPARREEVPALLKFLAGEFLGAEDPESIPDYRDLAGARVYAQLLGWYRNRVKDPYVLLGLRDGELTALATGRLLSREINVAFHTLSFLSGFRAGTAMNFARCRYCFEDLGQDELWSACESPAGWKNWAVDLALPSYPWPDLQHELGGGRVYYLSREYWESTVRGYLSDNYGIRLEREVPRHLEERNQILRFPRPPGPEPVKSPEPEAAETREQPAGSPPPRETPAAPSPEALPPAPGA